MHLKITQDNSVSETWYILAMCNFCAICKYAGKAGLSLSYWDANRKSGVTVQFLSKNPTHCHMFYHLLPPYISKKLGYPKFIFQFQ